MPLEGRRGVVAAPVGAATPIAATAYSVAVACLGDAKCVVALLAADAHVDTRPFVGHHHLLFLANADHVGVIQRQVVVAVSACRQGTDVGRAAGAMACHGIVVAWFVFFYSLLRRFPFTNNLIGASRWSATMWWGACGQVGNGRAGCENLDETIPTNAGQAPARRGLAPRRHPVGSELRPIRPSSTRPTMLVARLLGWAQPVVAKEIRKSDRYNRNATPTAATAFPPTLTHKTDWCLQCRGQVTTNVELGNARFPFNVVFRQSFSVFFFFF